MTAHFNSNTAIFSAAALVALVVALPTSAGAECRVRGEAVNLEEVLVRPVGDEPFTVALHGARATVTLRGDVSAPAKVEVEGALAFSGTRQRVWFLIQTAQRTSEGLVSIAPGAWLADARSVGSHAVGSIVLSAGDVPPGASGEPAEVVREVVVPCDALDLDGHFEDSELAPVVTGNGTFWELRSGAPVLLRTEPRWSAPFVRLGGTRFRGGPAIWFEGVAERGKWMQVVRHGYRVSVIGWLEKSRLTLLPGEPVEPGCCTEYSGRTYGHHRTTSARLLHDGPATISAGTKVYTLPGRGSWATITQATSLPVEIYEGDVFARVKQLPALSGPSAYVPVQAVVIETPVRQ